MLTGPGEPQAQCPRTQVSLEGRAYFFNGKNILAQHTSLRIQAEKLNCNWSMGTAAGIVTGLLNIVGQSSPN